MTCAFSASTANRAHFGHKQLRHHSEASVLGSTPSALADYSGHLSNQTNPCPH